jgi:RNA polymerase sigma factor (sigma-70 family)
MQSNALMRQYALPNNSNFNCLIKDFQKSIKATAYHYGWFLDYSLREDLEQAAYIALWNAYNKFDPNKGSFEHYARCAISNAIKSEISRTIKQFNIFEQSSIDDEEFIENYDNHKMDIEYETYDDINPVLSQLVGRQTIAQIEKSIPSSQQSIFEKVFLYGMSGTEVAKELGVTQQAISKHCKQIENFIISYQFH